MVNHPSKFKARSWVEIIGESRATYNNNNNNNNNNNHNDDDDDNNNSNNNNKFKISMIRIN